jgi:hypothetical protein
MFNLQDNDASSKLLMQIPTYFYSQQKEQM